ncbi:thymidine kinase [Clostridium massiliamazoniense]|uniref:thymidine kinase n=1 Tax=Clostridium massiliamazoniense TaxID=1347366 RepID=UPI0006D843C9|nr:thymidine kinase [Clostridium massiliamazoniense]
MSKLYFRYGAMNSGKSTHLMQVAHNYEERGMKIVLIKPAIDKKGEDKIVSRLGVERKADMLISNEDNILERIQERLKTHSMDCIIVDEVQFLKSYHIDQLFEIAVSYDIPVICYGLRTDFQMNGFEGSSRLLLIAHSIEEMKTICTCGKKAILNGRKINGKFIFEGEQVAIDDGGEVEYESLCGECYFKYKKN